MFIFFGLPLPLCLCAIPLAIVFIYLSVYGAYFFKAMELMNVSAYSNKLVYPVELTVQINCNHFI